MQPCACVPFDPPRAVGLEAPPGFEPGVEVLQTSALPLGDGAPKNDAGLTARAQNTSTACASGKLGPGAKVERETGFEPATSTLARSHSTTELFPPGEPLNYHEK